MEIWKDIDGYEGLYQVSNHGRIKSLERTYYSGNGHNTKKVCKEKILKPRKTRTGYCRVAFKTNGKNKDFYIHRLVAMHFLDNPKQYPDINHKDEIKSNNHIDNIEWCSRKYNCNYGTRNKRLSEINIEYRKSVTL